MDSFLNTVYTSIYNFARTGGIIGGGLVWQILAEGMNLYYDGYEIISSQNPSTSSVIAQQSHKMTTLQHIEKVEIDEWVMGCLLKSDVQWKILSRQVPNPHPMKHCSLLQVQQYNLFCSRLLAEPYWEKMMNLPLKF